MRASSAIILGSVAGIIYWLFSRSGISLSQPISLQVILAAAGLRRGVPSSWMLAIARLESNFNPNATNLTGGDLAREGAWGVGQVTLRTARAYGYAGDGPGLLDPRVNADYMAMILADARARWGNSFQDAAAYYNSGRAYASAPISTKTSYVPRATAFEAQARSGAFA